MVAVRVDGRRPVMAVSPPEQARGSLMMPCDRCAGSMRPDPYSRGDEAFCITCGYVRYLDGRDLAALIAEHEAYEHQEARQQNALRGHETRRRRTRTAVAA